MQEEFLFAGFGGQGVMFAGQLLAYAAMDEGLEVTWIPSYGPEMRGGTAHCYVVISDKPIGSPIVKHPKVVIVFNYPSFERYAPEVAPGGLLALNASLITQRSHRTDITELPVPATELADELGNLRLANVIMLGAVLAVRPVLSLDAMRHALENHIPEHRRDMLSANLEALERGADFAASLVSAGAGAV
ncbi:MAG TPA: 2-oxoacid:ferredoxin oxidoreductase subunit gamma [Chloroflexi bacterium]|nr:2-oxoacid:ferredoxin oxidoreductase subunit gamma [Chloroflexota bacterium]